jgi:hypothetical protein
MERIQVLIDPEEKEQFRRLAQERGLSLSAWLREAALKRAAEEGQVPRIRSADALRAFFSERDAREAGREPDWEEHLEVLDASRREGIGEPAPAARSSGGGGTPERRAARRKRR